MPVDTARPQYSSALQWWKRCRDASEGSDAIKEAGEDYLPRLSGQTDKEYQSYKDRALWYGFTARTVQALSGAIFRKDPEIAHPESLEPVIKDVTRTGSSLRMLAKTAVEDVILVGRMGLLVERPQAGTAENRTYLAPYAAERIINWKTVRRGGQEILALVVLEELVEEDGADEFETEEITRYRVLRLDEEDRYETQIWREKGDGHESKLVMTDSFRPIRGGERLDFIPFVFLGTSAVDPEIEKPPLLDLVDANLSHYRSSADLENGRHWTGFPSLALFGFDTEEEIKVGSSQALVSSQVGADGKFIEFTGQGLGALEKALQDKEQLMAVLGARMLEEKKSFAEASETHRIRQSGEISVLQSISHTLSEGLTKALGWLVWWEGMNEQDVSVALNSDFLDVALTAPEMTALMGLWQSQAISYDTFFFNLKRGEMMPESRTVEEEQQLIGSGAEL
ncbi:MAG: DUF4055 domain-containing protein [Acidobacteriota bacterium]